MADTNFDPEAFLAQETFDPDAFLGDVNTPTRIAPVEPYFAAGDMAPRANYVQPRPDEAQRMADVAYLTDAFKAVQSAGPAPAAQTLKAAQALRLPLDVVAANLPAMKVAAEVAGWDAEKFMRDSPELWRVLERTRDIHLAQLVVTDKPLGEVAKAVTKAFAFFGEVATAAERAVYDVALGLTTPEHDLAARRADSEAAKRQEISAGEAQLQSDLATRQVVEVDSPEARAMRGDPVAAVGQRWRESKAGLEVNRGGWELMNARRRGADTAGIEARIYDAQQRARPLALGDDRTVAEMVQGTASSTEFLAAGSVGAAAGAVGGGLLGGAAGALAAGPAGAAALGKAGAATGAVWVGGAATFAESLAIEAGGTYLELGDLVTEGGNRLSEEERYAGAMLGGMVKAGLEVAQLGALGKTLGPLTALLRGGGFAQLRAMLASNPAFRSQLAKAAGGLATAALANGAEEGAQQAVDQVTAYAVASAADGTLQSGRVFDVPELVEATVAGTLGSLPLGVLGTSVRLGASMGALRKAKRAEGQVKAIAALAANETVQAAPEAFAQVVAEAGEAEGEAATHLYVDAKAVQRFFQGKDEGEVQQQLELALGPDGPQRVQEALATGQRLEVPVETVLATWANSEVGKATVGDTTTAPGLLTPAELAVQGPQVEADAQALAEAEVAKATKKAAMKEALDTIEVELTETKRLTADEARQVRTVWQHFWETQADDAKVPAADLAARMRATFKLAPATDEKGQLSLMQGKTAEESLRERFEAQQKPELAEQGVEDFFVDSVTGLLNERAFKRLDGQGRLVARIGVEGVKYLNDTVTHDAGDAAFRAAAQALRAAAPEAQLAKVGGDFSVYVTSQAELDAVLEAANANPVLEGFMMTGAVGATSREADAAHGALKDKLEKDGLREKRGSKPGRGAERTPQKAKAVTGTPIDAKLREARAAIDPEAAYMETFRDPLTGLWTYDAWRLMPRKRFKASVDMNGVKTFNKVLTEAGTDTLIAAFGEVMLRLGGEKLDATHKSGDEFLLQSDSKEELVAWLREFDRVALGSKVTVKSSERQVQVQGLVSGRGIGETLGDADRALNRHKARLTRYGLRGEAATIARIVDLGEVGGRGREDGGEVRGGVDRVPAGPAAVAAQEDAVTRLKQDEGNAKGWVDLPDRDAVERVYRVFLSKQADVSTVMHESAHAFLDMLEALATGPKASPRTQETWAQARAWLGLEEGQRPQREHHEKWARSFEAWLMEGKAPARGLVKAFTRMRGWLMGIYRAVMGVPGAALNDEVRAIFSRLLATDAELESYKRALGPRVDMAALGVDEVAAQEEADEDAHAFTMGTRRLELALLREKQRQAEKAWKKGLAEEVAKAEGEYEVLPARVARRILDGEAEELVLANTPVTLEKAYVDAVLQGDKAAGIRTSDSEDAVHPDEVAGIINGIEGREVFATGADMLRAVVALPSREAWVKGKAQAAMEEREPSLARDRVRMRALLADGLHGAVERRMLADWAALTAKVGGRQPAVEALKRAARLIAEKRTVRGLRVNDALRAQAKAARIAKEAAAKGEWAVAIEAAQQEMLNGFLYRELLEAEADVERLEKAAKAAGKTSARATAGKASPTYRDAIDWLLAAVGLGPEERFSDETKKGFDVVEQLLEDDGQTPGGWAEVLAPVLGDTHYEDMTVAQVRAVAEGLAQMRAAVVNRTTVLTETGRIDKEEVVEQLVAEISGTLDPVEAPGTSTSDTSVQKFKALLSGVDAFLSNPIDLARDLSGGNIEGVLFRVLIDPLRVAKRREAKVLREVIAPLLDGFSKLSSRRLGDRVDGRKLFPNHVTEQFQPPRQRHELLMLALNAGNESNLQRLTDGRRISEAEVAAAIDTLTDEELAWVQKVFDQAETLRDDAFDLEERDSGLRPQAIEARPLRLPSGRVLRGGYFPAKYEAKAGQTGERQLGDAIASILDPSYVRPGTAHSHTKSRASQVEAVISLDINHVHRHFAQVAHDLAYREALKSVAGLVMDKAVDGALRKHLGAEKTKEFLLWLKAIGNAQAATQATNRVEQVHRLARELLPPAVLGFNLKVALGDLANATTAVVTTPLTTKHLAMALATMAKAPRETSALVLEKSNEYRNMVDETARKFQQAANRSTHSWSDAAKPIYLVKDNAFVLQETVTKVLAPAVWLGSYEQARQDGRDEAYAVKYADDNITRVFPQSAAMEKSRALLDRGFVGTAMMFMGYLNLAYRQVLHPFFAFFRTQAFAAAGPGRRVVLAQKALASVFAGAVAVGVLSELYTGRGPDDGDKDKEEPDDELLQWRNWFLRKLAMAPLAMTPMAEVSGFVEAQVRKRPASPRASPAGAVFSIALDNGMKAINGDATAEARMVAALKLIGLWVPTTPLTVQGRYLYEVATGARDVDGPADFISGALYGKKEGQPLNPITAAARLAPK